MTTVVNIRTVKKWTPEHVYIGRRAWWAGKSLPKSPFANPFRLGQDTRGDTFSDYDRWLCEHPELMDRARRELTGKILVCWCKPHPCHGDILAAICDKAKEG